MRFDCFVYLIDLIFRARAMDSWRRFDFILPEHIGYTWRGHFGGLAVYMSPLFLAQIHTYTFFSAGLC